MDNDQTLPDRWEIERDAGANNGLLIAGVDEAGRGPLAGPVVAAAVILPFGGFEAAGINDSKKLSPASRERAFARIMESAVAVGIGIVDAPDIDRLNILRATHHAMRLAVADLRVAPHAVFVDGLPVRDLHPRCTALVKGDSRCLSIGAASIIAKVTRDRLMCGMYHERFPLYDFPRHKGYPTPEHLAALELHGPCIIHRYSFGPVAQKAMNLETKS